jgi:hypothetical protein
VQNDDDDHTGRNPNARQADYTNAPSSARRCLAARDADFIEASGQMCRSERPDIWAHRLPTDKVSALSLARRGRSTYDGITREPEQVRAFRDTWRDGIHSYLTYLRDRLTVARDLLHESGSIFVQIGDENVHRVRALMDEVFGDENFVREIAFSKTSTGSGDFTPSVLDFLLWYSKSKEKLKVRSLLETKNVGGTGGTAFTSAVSEYAEKRPLTCENTTVEPKMNDLDPEHLNGLYEILWNLFVAWNHQKLGDTLVPGCRVGDQLSDCGIEHLPAETRLDFIDLR